MYSKLMTMTIDETERWLESHAEMAESFAINREFDAQELRHLATMIRELRLDLDRANHECDELRRDNRKLRIRRYRNGLLVHQLRL